MFQCCLSVGKAMKANDVIQWDDRLLQICGQVGKAAWRRGCICMHLLQVLQDDPTDGTAQAQTLHGQKAWRR